MGRLEKWVGNASIIILFQLFACSLFAQDTTYVQQFDMYADRLDKREMKTGLLYDRVFPFAKLNPQKNTKLDRDSIPNDFKNWKQVYLEMYNADYANVTKENFETFLEKASEFQIQNRKIPIGVINYQFDYIDSNALHDGRIVMIDGKPTRSTINGTSPYLQDSVCLLSMLSNQLYTGSNKIILDSKFYYTNTNSSIRKITLDFKNDKGKQVLLNGDSLLLNFSNAGEITYAYRIEFTNGKIVESDGMLSVVSSGTAPCFQLNLETSATFFDYDKKTANCAYEYGIYFKDCNNRNLNFLRNPILILDGFDPTNSRTLGNIFDLINTSPNNLGTKLLDEGHDIVICNFLKGADFIERNALAVREMIEFIKLRTTDKIIVIGPSMGGLIARYALAQIEKENKDHQTSLYISFDAPHQGANIPIGDQYFLHFFGDIVGDASAKEGLNQINSPAAKQMLLHHQSVDRVTPTPDKHRISYLDNVIISGKSNSNGYPLNLRKVSVINGSSISSTQGVNGKLFSLERKKIGIKVAEAQIYSSPNRGASEVAYCMAANRHEISNTRKMKKYASVVLGSPYPTNINNVPGGYFNTQQIITGLSKGQSGNGFHLDHAIHSFIPTTSALDLQFPTQYVNYNLNIKNANIYCNNQTPFDAYFAPETNEEHVFISDKNSEWILKEIDNATRSVGVTSNTLEISSGQVFNYGSNTKKYYEKSFIVSNGGVVGVNMNSPTGYNNEAIPATGTNFIVEGYNNECGSINIDVNSNGTLILGDANTNKGEWYISDNSVLHVRDFGKIIIQNNSRLVINRGSKLIIGKNSIIQLLGNNAQLIIDGDLEIEEDATLTFVGDGFINLKSNAVTWGRNAKLVLLGSSMNDKVLEIADARYLNQGYQNQSTSSIEIRNGLIYLEGSNSYINSSNKLILENVTISSGRGIVLNGQKDISISNCLFVNNKIGITCYSTQLEKYNVLGNPLRLTNTSFTNCDIGIKIIGKGFKINGVNFTNCNQGVVADGMDMPSELSNTFISNSDNPNANPLSNTGLSFVGIAGSTLTVQNSSIDKFGTGIYNSQSTLNLKCSNITSSKYQNLWIANQASLNMGPSGNSYSGNNTLTIQDGMNNKNIFLEQANYINLVNGENKFKVADLNDNYFVAGTMLNIPNTVYLKRNNWYVGQNNLSYLNPPSQNNFIIKLNSAPSSPRVSSFSVLPILGLVNSGGCVDFNKPVIDPCAIQGSCNEYLADPLLFSKNSTIVNINGYAQAPYNVVLKQILNQIKDDVSDVTIANNFNALSNLYLLNDKYDSSDVVYLKDLTYSTLLELFNRIYDYEFYSSNSKPILNYSESFNKLSEVQNRRYSILRNSENKDREFSVLMDMAQVKSKVGLYQAAEQLFNDALLVANNTTYISLANHWLCITNLNEQMLTRDFSPDQIDSALSECQDLMTSQGSAGRAASFKVDTTTSIANDLPRIYVSPNPSDGELTIYVNGDGDEEIRSIELYSLQGGLMLKMNVQPETTSQKLSTINIESGMYFLKVYTNSATVSKKVMINRK